MSFVDEAAAYLNETGLPELPEGYFWRIKKSTGIRWNDIQIRRKRFIGSTKMGEHPVCRTDEKITVDVIVRSAKYLLSLERVQQALAPQTAEPLPDPRQFYGDYPPKSLNK